LSTSAIGATRSSQLVNTVSRRTSSNQSNSSGPVVQSKCGWRSSWTLDLPYPGMNQSYPVSFDDRNLTIITRPRTHKSKGGRCQLHSFPLVLEKQIY
jgi:hypothetical protein